MHDAASRTHPYDRRRFLGTDVNPEAVRLTERRLQEFGAGTAPRELPGQDPDLFELASRV